jgi:cytochrome c oxidase subunit 3
VNFLQKVMAKPWEHTGEMEGIHGGSFVRGSPQGTGLKIFLAVVSSLFFLFIVSYYLRMELPDWRPLADPRVLWANSLFLLLGSIALQLARSAAKKDHAAGVRNGLVAGGLFTIAFLVGQFFAWRQLYASGFYATVNPSYAFFYLLTGLHAAHLAGGLWVWGRTTRKVWAGADVAAVRLSVNLCSLYWHYLLLVWLIMFSLLLST